MRLQCILGPSAWGPLSAPLLCGGVDFRDPQRGRLLMEPARSAFTMNLTPFFFLSPQHHPVLSFACSLCSREDLLGSRLQLGCSKEHGFWLLSHPGLHDCPGTFLHLQFLLLSCFGISGPLMSIAVIPVLSEFFSTLEQGGSKCCLQTSYLFIYLCFLRQGFFV